MLASPCGLMDELLMVRLMVDARDLEDTLEQLAELPFPVNPELMHRGRTTVIEFPAYVQSIPDLKKALGEDLTMETVSMLSTLGLS